MRAGLMRHRITLQQSTPTRGGTFSDPQEAWSAFATVWARVAPLSGREFFQNREVHGEVDHRITIRYLVGVTSKMRVQLGARIFQIESVIDLEERHVEQQLMCREVFSG